MTWPIAAVLVAGFGALVAMAHVALPYLRKRDDAENRLLALEAATAALTHDVAAARADLGERLASVETFASGGGPLGRLPRAGVSR